MNSACRNICLLALEDRHNISLKHIEKVCGEIASFGYYFEKISRAAYDNPDGIVKAFNECKAGYDTLFVLCPHAMESAVKQYASGLYGGEFNGLGILTAGKYDVFILYYDVENRLVGNDIKSALDRKYNVKFEKTYIRACAPKGIVERTVSEVSARITKSNGGNEVFFNLDESYGDYRIEIVYSSAAPKILVDETVRELVKSLGGYVYAMDDTPLAEQIYRLLKLRRLRIGVAESFTGGGVGKRLVRISGISEVFTEGLNTYSNLSKSLRLGVTELTLKQCGAVSAETAMQMAEGLLKTGNCEVAVATTGIAGPNSDNTSKPVGLAFIAVGVGDDVAVYKFNFTGDRQTITETAINQALFLTYKRLK